ncbi:hypothetical protein QFZ63_003830 [Streptomyces sp. B3I7]|uniref:HEPN domain-containing protein n=1 Tax=Streptomyces sp. B3I7 TaxID=3042269 RepID=UPI0027870495|nr:HEPN domain-containing protein [Streptomyces sp. B3I7]MDQ0812116.1 hypothetical protein [Streptomyces sp. B3I7]
MDKMETRSGVWWTDRDPHKRISGTLSRSENAWRLNLVGRLPEDNPRADGLVLLPPTTIYGSCLGTRYTLRHAYLRQSKGPTLHFGIPQDDRDRADDQYSQLWIGESLISGGTLPENTTYTSAIFEISGLNKWWPISRPDPRSEEDDVSEAPTVAECGDGWVVTIGVSGIETAGLYSHAINKWAVVQVKRASGFTLTQLEDGLMIPLSALVSIVTHEPAECFNLKLQPVDDAYRSEFPIEVDPGLKDRDDYGALGQVTFTPEQVDAASFISAWINTAKRNIVPVAATEPRNNRGSLQAQVVECVNAAETLHRTLHAEPDEYPFTAKVWDTLKGTEGLNRSEREKVRSAVRFVEYSLKDRLEELASDLGDEFCHWYLRNNAPNWALVSSAVRNALSHGYETRHGIEHDIASLIGVVRITRSIIALRLLVAAGLPTGHQLIDIVKNDRHYLSLLQQSVADWSSLAQKINSV